MIDFNEVKSSIVKILQISAQNTDIERFDIDRNINLAVKQIINDFPAKFLTNVISTKKYPLLANRDYYQLPDDFVRLLNVWIDYENPIVGANEGRLAIIPSLNNYASSLSSLATKRYPFVDVDVEKGIRIFPMPDKSVHNGLRIRYVYSPPLSSQNQKILLDDKYEPAIINLAASKCAAIDGYNIELSNMLYEKYLNELKIKIPKVEAS